MIHDLALYSAVIPDLEVIAVSEDRIAPRYKCDKRAIAEYGGDKYHCTIRDLSSTGAAIEFSDLVRVIPITKGFNLILPDDGLKLPCRIVWKRDYRMGVTFD